MHSNDRRGFSLVEMAVVVTIAGLILAISAPGLIRQFNSQRVRDSAGVLRDEMRLARQKAITNGTRNYIYCGVTESQYFRGLITQRSDGVWPTTITWTGPYDLPSKTKHIAANFSGYVYFFYDPSGRPKQPVGTSLSSGSVKVVSTVPGVTDTTTISLDLSGSVW
jgi:prepilin-type N-terminal cleavage/methylation domain-containing protein